MGKHFFHDLNDGFSIAMSDYQRVYPFFMAMKHRKVFLPSKADHVIFGSSRWESL